jgi:hypothetical protein
VAVQDGAAGAKRKVGATAVVFIELKNTAGHAWPGHQSLAVHHGCTHGLFENRRAAADQELEVEAGTRQDSRAAVRAVLRLIESKSVARSSSKSGSAADCGCGWDGEERQGMTVGSLDQGNNGEEVLAAGVTGPCPACKGGTVCVAREKIYFSSFNFCESPFFLPEL